MSLTGDDKNYATARKTLISGLIALADFPPGSFVLVGAHAVYLRAPRIVPSMAPFTLDGDLAADPRKIGRPRDILDRLEAAGFSLRGEYGGLYGIPDAPQDEKEASKLDILVPQGVAHPWKKLDSYGARDVSATMEQPGLELALFDHSPMTLSQIDPSQRPQSIRVEVAGTVALIVAKGWKIGERFEQVGDSFQEVGKDVGDVYRLLAASNAAETRATLEGLPLDGDLRGIARKGARYLLEVCSGGRAGTVLLRNFLGRSDEADVIVASFEALVEEFHADVEASLGRG
jgi:hypothetical protein